MIWLNNSPNRINCLKISLFQKLLDNTWEKILSKYFWHYVDQFQHMDCIILISLVTFSLWSLFLKIVILFTTSYLCPSYLYPMQLLLCFWNSSSIWNSNMLYAIPSATAKIFCVILKIVFLPYGKETHIQMNLKNQKSLDIT